MKIYDWIDKIRYIIACYSYKYFFVHAALYAAPKPLNMIIFQT